ncbi:SURF1 family protein [soil metagenome]
MSRYRFALRPRWIVSHLFVLVLVAAMITAGFWQLSRMGERQDRNETVEARTAEPVADALGLAAPGAFDQASDLEYRRVATTGRYLADEEVLVRSRSREGSPGSWVLTPLLLADGTVLPVNRGWISNSGQLEAVPTSAVAPDGEVTVTGLVRRTETREGLGPTDPATGRLDSLARADVARLDQQVPADLLPFYVQLAEQEPAVTTADPVPVPPPELDDGPHLSYAAQWFIFAAVAVVGYPLILRRRAGEIERGDPDDGDPLDRPDPLDDPAPDDPRLDPTPADARRPEHPTGTL